MHSFPSSFVSCISGNLYESAKSGQASNNCHLEQYSLKHAYWSTTEQTILTLHASYIYTCKSELSEISSSMTLLFLLSFLLNSHIIPQNTLTLISTVFQPIQYFITYMNKVLFCKLFWGFDVFKEMWKWQFCSWYWVSIHKFVGTVEQFHRNVTLHYNVISNSG